MTGPNERSLPALEALLAEGVRDGVFPGAVAVIGALTAHGSVGIAACAGVRAPGEPAVTRTTPYDLASLTKPVVAALALRLSQQGAIDLHAPVGALAPDLADTPAGDATLEALLAHRAGLVAWRSLADGVLAEADPRRAIVRAAACGVDPARRDPRTSVYSDLGYVVVGHVLSAVRGEPLDALVRREVTAPLGLAASLFYPAAASAEERAALIAQVAPTEQVPGRGSEVLRGVVHDDNAHALGGVAGHAGLFGSAPAVCAFGLAMLNALEGRSRWLDQALVRWALRPRPGGTHVVGWDTPSAEGSSAGAQLSAQAFGHLGFTGTSIWCDPPRRMCAVLLSNRVHPTRDNVAIRAFRPRFHDLVASLVDAGALGTP